MAEPPCAVETKLTDGASRQRLAERGEGAGSARGPAWAKAKRAGRVAQCDFLFPFCLKMLDV